MSGCLVCGAVVMARGYCSKHYKRYLRHGVTDDPAHLVRGRKRDHPLFHTWRWFRYGKLQVEAEWRNDFWRFVEDVGDRMEDARLLRVNALLPLGPKNFYWKAPLKQKPKTPTPVEQK